MKTIPYTTKTGVKIGSRYNESPKPMPIDDPDMEFIQELFIHSGKWHRQKAIAKLITNVSTGIALLIIITYTMVSK
jgi:hypothetical protein